MKYGFYSWFGGLAVGLVFGMLLGGCAVSEIIQRSAMKAGVAEWVSNDNGRHVFKWKGTP